MFSTVLNEVTGYLDRRFVLSLLFPSIVFWGGLALVFSTPVGLERAISMWLLQNGTIQILEIIGVVAWLVFFASLLNNQLVWITRQYEGYWDWMPFGIGRRLRSGRTTYYQRVIEEADDYRTTYYWYPPSKYSKKYSSDVMPTKLGNILKNSELYPYERYKIDAVLFWPRLPAVLGESYTQSLEASKSSMDFMLIVSFLSSLFAIISGIALFWMGSSWWLFFICFLGGFALAIAAYLSALRAAVSYGQLIKGAFDMYKGDLLSKMGYAKPTSLEEERVLWESIGKLLYRGAVDDNSRLQYDAAVDK